MDQQTIIAEIEARAKALKCSIAALSRLAGMGPTTFSRWKLSPHNPQPMDAKMGSIRKMSKVLDSLEAQSTPLKTTQEKKGMNMANAALKTPISGEVPTKDFARRWVHLDD